MPIANVNVPSQIDNNLTASTTQGASKSAIISALAMNLSDANSYTDLVVVAAIDQEIIDRDAAISAYAQPLDSDLTSIAGLTPSNDDIIQRKAGAWINRTMAQLWADLKSNADALYVRIIHKTVTNGTTITGTTSQTLTYSFEIPANTFVVGDVPEFSLRGVFTGTAGAKRITVQLNTTNAIGGTQIATNLTASTALSADMARRIAIKSTTNTEVYNSAINSLLADNVSTTAVTSANIDWTQSVWFIVSITLANSADSGFSSFVKLTT